MKIAIIGHLKHPVAKPFAGGLESFTYDYVEALVDRGHHVTLFASADSDTRLPLHPIIDAATVPESIRRLGSEEHQWIEAVEDEAYESLMDGLSAADFDVIHNHSLSPIPLRFAAIQSCPVITTLHVPPLVRMKRELARRDAKSCGVFVNVSHANAASWALHLKHQHVIHNGVKDRFWNRCASTKVDRAIWFGRILADKGTHLAIEAAHMAGVPIDIVGPISDSAYFDNQILPRLNPDDQYHGHRDHDELCQLISRSTVSLATPCWDEPFGLVVAESLACGTPVAGFRRGALPEIVRSSVGRLAAPGDVNQLAKCIAECRDLRGEVCRRYVQEQFGFSRMVNAYEDLYRQIGSPRPTFHNAAMPGAKAA
ncbi:glycosyltransferase family 4 protein [Stieleria sp. JC731]|uniref:glycosyltransferase family 4 protein n=1 Tax=Pirellulaceae TaxID=2691357 RepID=UPI001E286461|nr:glycosyltransferase family 4 protein [Stieleria sp. JC731]MCC9600453.1 glycosyltransferase family 4 protein [Stieleria sp. JC731]